MRIISGKFKGKHIHAPRELPVRPTTDIAKEGLFNIIEQRYDLEQCEVLDLFAGTGNISFEFVSRGVKWIEAVDRHTACIRFIDQQFKQMNFKDFRVFRTDVFIAIPRFKRTFDLIFCDPPYDFSDYRKLADQILACELLKPNGLLIIEHPKEIDFSSHAHFQELRKYGKVNFSFFTLHSLKQS